MAVTGLQNVTNKTGTNGTFANSENGGNDRKLPDFPDVNVGNAWIPWANNGAELKDHHFAVQTGKGTKYIYQSGDIIYSADSADNNGFNTATKLFTKVGVSVNLTINSDGSLTMKEA